MVKEKLDNKWSLPGVWAEVNLSISENAIKESLEEAGVNIKPSKIIAILDKNKYSKKPNPYGIYKIFVLCELIGGEFKNNIETSQSNFFIYDNLPELSVERNTKEQIKMCFDCKTNSNFNTIFN